MKGRIPEPLTPGHPRSVSNERFKNLTESMKETNKILKDNLPPLYPEDQWPVFKPETTTTFTENGITKTLEDRGSNYGKFFDQATFVQEMKEVVRLAPKWKVMENDQREAVDMILSKISRIVNGNPDLVDSWHDISGYAKLVEDRLNGTVR